MSGGASAGFVYDGDGQRVKGTVNGVTTVYIGDYYEQSGSTVKKYYYAGGQRVAMRENGTLYWLLTDHLGSTAITANGSGNRVAELRYKAWGETRYTWGTTPTAYKFTGQRLDDSTGLYYYGARYYDAALGRFLQPDPLVPEPGNPQALNRYAYVLNNPIKYRDPSGHWVETAWDIANIAWDIYEVRRDPRNAWNWVALAADVGAAIIPFVPGGVGAIVHGGKAAKVAVEAASHLDEATDVARVVAEAASHADEAADALRRARKAGEAAPQVVRQLYEKGVLSGIRPAGEWESLLQGMRQKAGLEVHHLIERRFAERLGLRKSEIPAIVLDRTFHQQEVTARLFSGELGLPTGGSYSPQQIWEAYARVYGAGPQGLNRLDWLEAIWPYFERLGVQR